jgi:hypothetical protein
MRDYDPTTGRYIQADPLGLVDGASVYGYARQNPNAFVDPMGLCPMCLAAAAGAGAAAITSILDQMIANCLKFQCINWNRVGFDALLGGAAGVGIGAAIRVFGGVSKAVNPARPTFHIGRKNQTMKKLGIRIEDHPIRKNWPNNLTYPHGHLDKLGKKIKKRHLPIVEPVAAAMALMNFSNQGCGCE